MSTSFDRRTFLLAVAAGVAGAASGCGLSIVPTSDAGAAGSAHQSPSASPSPQPTGPYADLPTVQDGPASMPAPAGPPPRVVDRLPERAGRTVALTIDDGAEPDVVQAYLDFAKATGVRFTFFVTAKYQSWREHRAAILPLVESGQVQLGNHTWSHLDLRRLSDDGIASELDRCERFLNQQFGVTAKPFFRPPFGVFNTRVRAVAHDLGYRTTTMWYGTLGDAALLTEQQLMAQARQWLLAQRVVIGHANHPTVTHLYGEIVELLQERSLLTATLDDVFYATGGRERSVRPSPGATVSGAPTRISSRSRVPSSR